MTTPIYRPQSGSMRWPEVDVLEYKREPGVSFREVTRQVLFDDTLLSCQFALLWVAAGGHTALERHEHACGPDRAWPRPLPRRRSPIRPGNTRSCACPTDDLASVSGEQG
jgi:hypothetical protein